jgi:hypothetical protein
MATTMAAVSAIFAKSDIDALASDRLLCYKDRETTQCADGLNAMPFEYPASQALSQKVRR